MDSWRKNPLAFWVFAIPPAAWLLIFFLVPLGLVWVLSFGEKIGLIDIRITWTAKPCTCSSFIIRANSIKNASG